MSQHNSNASGWMERVEIWNMFSIERQLSVLVPLEKNWRFTEGWSLSGPSGDFQVEEERIIWQFYYFLAGCLCTSISLSSNLCEAITVPLCSGVLLIVGSYNLSPLTKQKGSYTTHFPPMRDEFESILTSLSTRESDSCYRMFVLTYLLYTISTAAVKYNL